MIPILVLAYPVIDTSFMRFLRPREGRPVFQGGKDRFSHWLVSLRLRQTGAVLLIFPFLICHALMADLVTSVTLRFSVLPLATSAAIMFIFDALLRNAKG